MRRSPGILATFLVTSLRAGDAPDLLRVLCDPEDPANGCPGETCLCAPDSLEIAFEDGTNVLELAPASAGSTFDLRVFLAVRSEAIQGWIYGVAHDEEFLHVLCAHTREDLNCVCLPDPCGDVQWVGTCVGPYERGRCADWKPGGGWISSAIFCLSGGVSLLPGRNLMATASYRVERDPGEAGTRIQFSDRLSYKLPSGSLPPAVSYLTVDGRSRRWTTAAEGLVRTAPVPFVRGDANGDLAVDISDPIAVLWRLFAGGPELPCDDAADANDDGSVDLSDAARIVAFLFRAGPEAPPPAGACGLDPTPDALACARPPC